MNKAAFIKFLYSPNLYFGTRQAMGLFIPIAVFFILFKNYNYGYAFASGALGLLIIDQPWGATRRARIIELFAGLVLVSLGTTITNIVSPYPLISWFFVALLVFTFSMFSAYGRVGAQIGFGSLLAVLLSLNNPQPFEQGLIHSALTFGGCLFYFLFSSTIGFIFRHQQNRQIIATALYDTAKYIKARSTLYDVNLDLDTSFRMQIDDLSRMLASQQLARDVVLRNLPSNSKESHPLIIRTWNIFIAMVNILDTMVATQTDYEYLREKLGNHDFLLFVRDTLLKLSITLDQAATKLLMHRPLKYRNSVKAELRAIEFEIENFKLQDLHNTDPELYALLIQIQRRLRNATFAVEQITQNLLEHVNHEPINTVKLDNSLLRFKSENDYRLSVLTRQLNMNSATFRYSLRITLAIFTVQILTAVLMSLSIDPTYKNALMLHTSWILITVLLIMRPGFALTQQRTSWRLIGTFSGCLVTIGLFMVTQSNIVFLLMMLTAMILGNATIQKNFRIGSMFITIYVLIGFHFLSQNSYWVVGERFLDTLIACIITFIFSFILPRWEKDQIPSLAINTINAVSDYLKAAMEYIHSIQQSPPTNQADIASNPYFIALQLSRKNTYIAYGAFADSFSRMMNEPKRKQLDVVRLYRVLLQLNALISQVNSIVPIMSSYKHISEGVQQSFDYITQMLTLDSKNSALTAPAVDPVPEYINLRFPTKQMYKAVQVIFQEAELLGLQK